ncbi:NAD-glutamate dehydrogenase [Virgibacillus ndiopensis]|nr:NAD-glutamate dehydrogenase [Virgibacillus ndiopensis]
MKMEGAGEKIEKTAERLIEKGVPARTAAYAASMGYLRHLKKK